MSILIKGMEMPESCDTCFLSKWDTCNERFYCMFDDCPLVEVPAPHGDLIDIDSKITIGIKDGLKVTTVRKLLNDTAVRLPKTVIGAEDGDAE